MPTLDFALRVISPAFIAGAMEEIEITRFTDQHGNPIFAKHRFIGKNGDGLRIPSLRGVLRFWFRAMKAQLTMLDLKTAEAEVFGDTERGQGIRLIPNGIENWRAEKVNGDNSLGYLGYGPVANVPGGSSSHHRNSTREAILPGTIFNFRAIGNKLEHIEALKRCLLLLHLFGGIGSRSRRAWGSLAVIGDFLPSLKKDESILDWFKRTLLSLWPKDQNPFTKLDLPSFSAFSANTKICISKKEESWSFTDTNYTKLMRQFFNQFKKIRHYQNEGSIGEADHGQEKLDFDNSRFTYLPKRIVFGMPFTASSRNNWGVKYKAFKDGKEVERRASPLFLKVFHGPDERLYAVSLLLKSNFLGVADRDVEFGAEKYISHNKWAPLAQTVSFPFEQAGREVFWDTIENQFMECDQWQKIPLTL